MFIFSKNEKSSVHAIRGGPSLNIQGTMLHVTTFILK